ncbi:MAG: acyl-CoA dehydrogenase family protein [Streptosporangiaceae bacterium]
MSELLTRPADTVRAPARARFRAFVDEFVTPCAAAYDASGTIPPEVLDAVAAAGLWAAVLPEARGGTGTGMADFGILHEEVGRGCSSLRSMLTVHSMVLHALDRWGTPSLRERWLEPMISGQVLGGFCLTEPDAGSDIAALQTTAQRGGSGYQIDGLKQWTTGGQRAGVLLTFARTERGISVFLVDGSDPGVSRQPVEGMLGTRASMLAHIRFDGCLVGADALIGVEGAGLGLAAGLLDIGRYSVACGSVGIIQACLEASVRHAAWRTQGGGGQLRQHQLIQQLITKMAVDAQAARLLCEHAGSLKDAGDPVTLAVTCHAKYFASTAAMRAASDAVQIQGAMGCAPGADVARYFRDAKVMEIIEGSTQILELLIANDACQRLGERGPRPEAATGRD